jgi:NitT/TauT family transport system permease protein
MTSYIKMFKSRCSIILVPIPLFIVLWEIVSRVGLYNIALFPPPSRAFLALIEMLREGTLLSDVFISVKRVFIGFCFGSIAGISIGTLTGRSKFIGITLGQLIQIFRPIPVIAFVSLTIIFFGLGEFSKYFLITWGVFFPVWLNTYTGVSRVESSYLRAAQSLGANKKQLFYEVIIPAALPYITAGMRISIAVAYICLIVAEMTGASEGLGYRIEITRLVFRIDKMIAILFILGILGAISDGAFVWCRNKLLPWHKWI